MPALLVLLFIVVPIAELAVIIQVGSLIGVWPTIAILVLDSVVGAVLWRSQGRAAWRRFQAALAAGRPPATEVIDGTLIIFGGALLLTPGFLTDVLGIALLFPPTRALLRRVLVRRMVGAFVSGRFARPSSNGAHGPDVEGRAVDLDPQGRLQP